MSTHKCGATAEKGWGCQVQSEQEGFSSEERCGPQDWGPEATQSTMPGWRVPLGLAGQHLPGGLGPTEVVTEQHSSLPAFPFPHL